MKERYHTVTEAAVGASQENLPKRHMELQNAASLEANWVAQDSRITKGRSVFPLHRR